MSVEHKCVLESCHFLETEGYDITYIDPEEDGLLDLNKLNDAIRKDTILISVMGVNNETGVIQNLKEIGKIAHDKGILFHTDCAQAYGKIHLDVEEMNIDLMSISGHKIYGPKGIGALFVRKHGKHAIDILPQMNGGGQEHGIRSGTLAVPLIVGLGKAAYLMKADYKKDKEHIEKLAKKLKSGLKKIPDSTVNGSEVYRYAGNLNFSFKDVDAMTLVQELSDTLALSIGSACGSSHETVDSYVIKALGIDTKKVGGAVRIGIGRFTTEKEIDFAIKTITDTVKKIRDKKRSL
jgi:cysteine desulfurase